MSRNLIEYPITKQEVLDVLDVASREYTHLDDTPIGDLNSYILDRIRVVIEREFKTEDFNP